MIELRNPIAVKTLALLSTLLLLCSCKTSMPVSESREDETVDDYAHRLLRENDPKLVRAELNRLIAKLADEGTSPDIKQQILKDLFFVEDRVRSEIREIAHGGGENKRAAKFLLWFLGDRDDVKWASVENYFEATKLEIAKSDLADALRSVGEASKIAAGEFRVSAVLLNRTMDKAYVQVVVGYGPLNCSGEGFMFHRIDGLWCLIWSRQEWVS